MIRNAVTATVAGMCVAFQTHASAAEELSAGKIPPIVPAMDEMPIRGVPVFTIHQELQQCLKDATTFLNGGAPNARIGTTLIFSSQSAGYILRADFSRDDVSPPLINRIVCWHTGQLIASRISAPPLPSEQSEKALAVPHAFPQRK